MQEIEKETYLDIQNFKISPDGQGNIVLESAFVVTINSHKDGNDYSSSFENNYEDFLKNKRLLFNLIKEEKIKKIIYWHEDNLLNFHPVIKELISLNLCKTININPFAPKDSYLFGFLDNGDVVFMDKESDEDKILTAEEFNQLKTYWIKNKKIGYELLQEIK